MSMSSTTNERGTEGGRGTAAVRAAVGIINVRMCRAPEDVGAVEVPLVRVAELVLVVLVDGKMVGVVLVLVGSSIDGRRMVGGLRVGAGVRRGRGRLYDAMHRLIGGDVIAL
jgi:hypothetical protein